MGRWCIVLLGFAIGQPGCSLVYNPSGGGGGGAAEDAGDPIGDGAVGFAPWQLDLDGIAGAGSLLLGGQVHVDTTQLTVDGSATGVQLQLAATASGQPVAVLAAESITIAADAQLRGEGGAALVLLANTIVVAGSIDVSSRLGQPPGAGAGADPVACGNPNTTGRSGGGGGGHNGAGGSGGTGLPEGGSALPLVELSSGCQGSRNVLAMGAARAGSGGALQLVARELLDIRSGAVIEAGGAGGHAGGGVCCANSGGGGGGGAGGMIVLDASALAVESGAILSANGGGGGGGLDVDDVAMPGTDASAGATAVAGGPSGCFGGVGGDGGSLGSAPTAGGIGEGTAGHGGGGGAAGRIVIVGDEPDEGLLSPAPTLVTR